METYPQFKQRILSYLAREYSHWSQADRFKYMKILWKEEVEKRPKAEIKKVTGSFNGHHLEIEFQNDDKTTISILVTDSERGGGTIRRNVRYRDIPFNIDTEDLDDIGSFYGILLAVGAIDDVEEETEDELENFLKENKELIKNAYGVIFEDMLNDLVDSTLRLLEN